MLKGGSFVVFYEQMYVKFESLLSVCERKEVKNVAVLP